MIHRGPGKQAHFAAGRTWQSWVEHVGCSTCDACDAMKTHALFHPFDLFGHSGTRQGAELLADAVEEMLRDNRRETRPTRARSYTKKVQVDEFLFDKPSDYDSWRRNAREAIAPILESGDFLVWATGNHLGALPVYDVLAAGQPPTTVIQFDAHLDVYNLADSTAELSHGNFLRHVEGTLPRVVNIGHREQVLPPSEYAPYFDAAISAAEVHADPSEVVRSLRQVRDASERIVIDIDCDVFDAAYFPAVAQPEPFGLSPALVLNLLDEIWSPKIRGLVVSEFFPPHDDRDRSLATLLWLVEWVFLKNHETGRPK